VGDWEIVALGDKTDQRWFESTLEVDVEFGFGHSRNEILEFGHLAYRVLA